MQCHHNTSDYISDASKTVIKGEALMSSARGKSKAALRWPDVALSHMLCHTGKTPFSLWLFVKKKNNNNNNFRCAQSLPPMEPAPQAYIHAQCQVQILIPSETHWPGCWWQLWAHRERASMDKVVESHLPASHQKTMELGYIHCWPSDYHSRFNHYNTLGLCQQTDGRTRGLLSSRCLLVHLIISNSGKCNNC